MASDFAARIEATRSAADLALILRELRRREARRRHGPELSYRQIAARTGWSVAAVGAYLNGTRMPSTDRFRALVAILGADRSEWSALASARSRVAERTSPVAVAVTPAEQTSAIPQPGSAEPAAEPVARALPAPVVGFVGRETELTEFDRTLAKGSESKSVVILVVTGMAGVGKSALAVQWAHRMASGFPDGQLYVDLHGSGAEAPLSTMDSLGVLLNGLGAAPARLPPDLAGRLALYQARLRHRAALVVLDNAGGAEQVRPLLPPAPGIAVVTSQESLDDLDGAGTVRRIVLDPLSPADATGLLRRLVGTRVDQEPAAARTLARHCGYLPLALRVAAENVAARPGVPLAELVAELTDVSIDLDAFEVPGDRRSDVRTVFSWSVRRLPEPAVRLFRLLSLVPGPSVDRYGLAAIAGRPPVEVDRLGATLLTANLLRDPGGGRFAMHDLLRRFARELCQREVLEDDRRAALDRLFDHYLATGAAAVDRQFPLSRSTRPDRHLADGPPVTPAPEFPDGRSAAAWLAAERVNLVRACEYAAAKGWPGHAVALALVLRPFLDGGYDEQARAVHTAALAAAQRLGDRCDLTDRAGIRTGLGIANWRLGRIEEAIEHLGTAFEENLQAGNAGGATLTMAALGLVHDAQGRYRDAIDCQRRGLMVARTAGIRVQEAVQLINLGFGYLRIEEYERASDLYRAAYEIFLADGERQGVAHARSGLAAALLGLRRYDEALTHAEEAVAAARSFAQATYRLRTMATIGSIHRRMGRPADALDRLAEALRECRELNHPRPTAHVLNTLGETYTDLGDHQRALASHAEALALADRGGERWERTRALVGLGDAHAAAGDPQLARGYWQQAYDAYLRDGLPAAGRVQARLAATPA